LKGTPVAHLPKYYPANAAVFWMPHFCAMGCVESACWAIHVLRRNQFS
jgi:hypothetical protein